MTLRPRWILRFALQSPPWAVVLETQQFCLYSLFSMWTVTPADLWRLLIWTCVVCLFCAICMPVAFVKVWFSCVASFLVTYVPDRPHTVSLNVVAWTLQPAVEHPCSLFGVWHGYACGCVMMYLDNSNVHLCGFAKDFRVQSETATF